MKRVLSIGMVGIAAAAVAVSCATKKQAAEERKAVAPKSMTAVHSIVLPRYTADLPPGPGREAFATACLSCHSPSYMQMQPPMTVEKWAESVKKMAATYKAPIPDDQVQPIAEYLVAAKENGPGFRMTSVAAIPERFDEAVNLTIDTNDRAAVTHGEQLYGTHCASCHGAGGRGDGVAAKGLLPPPTDFTAARFSSKLLYRTIHQGVPATAMPAYGNLSDKDTASIVSYLQTLAPAASTNSGSNEDARTLYAQNCASCHGATGHADGVASAPLPRPPANFGMKQPTAEAAYRAITDGVPGTAMTAWKSKLTEPQRQALAEYVRTFGSSAGK